MPRTRSEIIKSIKTDIEAASPQVRVDADKGPFFHLSATGVAGVLSDSSSQIERLAQLSTLMFPAVATDQEAQAMARAFGLSTAAAGFSGGIAYAFTSSRPSGSDLMTVSEGTSFSTGTRGVVFEAVETRSLTAGNADAYYNPATRRYELPVRVRATSAGTLGNIAARTITSVQLSGFDGATNLAAFRGGTEAQSVATLYRRIQQRLVGLDNFSRGGLVSRVQKYDVDRVQSVALTYSNEYPNLFYRLPDRQAIDVWVLGTPIEEIATETFTASAGQTTFTLSVGPVLFLSSVLVNGSSVAASLTMDEGASLGGSSQESSQVTTAALVAGDVVDITYGYDDLIKGIQKDIDGLLNSSTGSLFATDVLVRYPKTIPVVVRVSGTVLGSFDRTTVEQEVLIAVGDYLANGLEGSPQQGGVRNLKECRDAIKSTVPGISLLEIPEFCRKSVGGIVEVIDIPRNAQLVVSNSADLVVSFT